MASRIKKVLIIDDYEEHCKVLVRILSPFYECFYTLDSTKAFSIVIEKKPDLILLDYIMPAPMGLDICKMIREDKRVKDIPIIFISGASTVDEKILALEHGANDFILKPFHAPELVLRVKARLSAEKYIPTSFISLANLQMNLLTHKVYVDGTEVRLTPRQFAILKVLASKKNTLVTRESCLSEIWGDCNVQARNVDAQINTLKRKISKFNGKIIAVHGLGYRLEVEK
jgi:two-component system, OmpR family, alkaline phosphatase synthesis response regulator PhoP